MPSTRVQEFNTQELNPGPLRPSLRRLLSTLRLRLTAQSFVGGVDRQALLHFFLFVLILVIIFDDIQFNGIESDDLEFGRTLAAHDGVPLIGVRVNVDFSFTLRACSDWHFVFTSSAINNVEAHPFSWGDLHLERVLVKSPTI